MRVESGQAAKNEDWDSRHEQELILKRERLCFNQLRYSATPELLQLLNS